MRVIVEEITIQQDQRGVVFEPLTADVLASQRNVHVVLTGPGGVRGNHQHQLGTEIVTVYGPALVRLRDGKEFYERIVAEGCVARFTIPAGVSHAFKNIGGRPNLLICFHTEVHDQSNPDVVPDFLIKDLRITEGAGMENRQYPRYVVRGQDGRIIGIAVCNLEVQEPQKPPEPKDQTSVGKESALQDPPIEREQI